MVAFATLHLKDNVSLFTEEKLTQILCEHERAVAFHAVLVNEGILAEIVTKAIDLKLNQVFGRLTS